MASLYPASASTPRRPLSVLGREHLHRLNEEWTLADWMIGAASVALALGSAGFFAVSYSISVQSPGFFQKAALANLPPRLDRIETGSVSAAGDGEAMPAPTIVRVREPVPTDYQIVMVFQDEALLATENELIRVRVGSDVPGLGTIRGIEGSTAGVATVTADRATLRSAASAP